jgi:hypothetical protein
MKNNSKEYLDKIVTILEKPYFYEMRNYGIRDNKEQEYILSNIFGFNIKIENERDFFYGVFNSRHKEIYYEDFYSSWWLEEYDERGNVIYFENGTRTWRKNEYDLTNYLIRTEGFDSLNNTFYKVEYNENGEEINYEEINNIK